MRVPDVCSWCGHKHCVALGECERGSDFKLPPGCPPQMKSCIICVYICAHNFFFSLVFFFSMSSLQLLLVATEMSGSQCIAGGCILFTRLLILSLLAYFFSFGLWFSLCMCVLMFKSVNKGLLLPYVKNVWRCEEFLPVGAQIHYFILGEAVKLHCFPFFVEKEGKVALGSQMRWIYFFVLIQVFFCMFGVSHTFCCLTFIQVFFYSARTNLDKAFKKNQI